ncbi:MAG: VWA domain-containing protein [Acidobacteria bacterium]|nr:VWA domain-containing protein [Acidobacteriota bacterium]MBV9188478.1 VWA domain-containing protein [Acidobacteriota bacterium]
MRKIVVAVALLFAVSSQSQQGRKSEAIPQPNAVAPPPPLVEKIDVSVVNVDVTVTDRRGQPVSGLTRDDFEIFEDDKLQAISNFYAVDSGQPKIDTRASGADANPSADRFRRKVLVLIDNQNTTPHGRNVALDRLVEFIDGHFDDGRYDWSIATIDKRIHMVLPMTSSKKVLHNVVAEVRRTGTLNAIRAPMQHGEFDIASISAASAGNKGGRDLNEVVETNRNLTTENTIDIFSDELSLKEQSIFAKSSTESILEAERAFGNLEGRKIILLVTGYLPLGTQSPLNRGSSRGVLDADTQYTTRLNNELAEMRDLLVREANVSNTSLYIISSEGLDMNMSDGINPMAAGPAPGSNAIDTSSMLWLAKETGGAYLPGNRIDQSLVDFDRRSGAFYSLGYSPLHSDDGHYYKLKVNVKKHRDYRLDYRYGYSSAPTDMQIIRAISSPLGAAMQQSTVPISLTFGEPVYRGIVALIPLKAAMSMDSLQYISDGNGSRTRLHVYVSIFDSEGRNLTVAKSFADIAVKANESTTGPMTVTIPPLALSKGTYKIVVAVRDELTDHIGVATKRLEL